MSDTSALGKVSFVVPCFCSESTLEGVVDEIFQVMEPFGPFEIVLVNDASRDDTSTVLAKLAATHKNVKTIELSRNFGQHSAWMAGFRFITGDTVVIIEDDGQTPIDELPKLFEGLRHGYDVVYGCYDTKKHSPFRNFGTWLHFQLITFLFDKPRDLSMSSFGVFRKFVIEEIKRYENPYPYLAGLVLNATRNIGNVSVAHRARVRGKSGYTLRKLISILANATTAYSVKPLRVTSIIGFISVFLGLIFGIDVVLTKFRYPTVPLGYTSIMTVLLFIGGFLMISLGLIGEYVGRIYVSLNRSPQYVIKSTTNIKQ